MSEETVQAEEKPQVEASQKGEQTSEETSQDTKAIEGDSELVKKLNEQETRIDAKLKELGKRRLALNAQQRELQMSGKALAVKQEKPVVESDLEYAKRVMRGEFNK